MMPGDQQQREKKLYLDFVLSEAKPAPPPKGLRKLQDLAGVRFFKLVAVGHVQGSGNEFDGIRWRLLCRCGSKRTVHASAVDLISGRVRDCGCAKQWTRRKRKERRRTDARNFACYKGGVT